MPDGIVRACARARAHDKLAALEFGAPKYVSDVSESANGKIEKSPARVFIILLRVFHLRARLSLYALWEKTKSELHCSPFWLG